MTRYGLREYQWEPIKDLLPGRAGDVGATARDTAALSKRFSIATAPEFPGVIFRSASATGKTPTSGSTAGKAGIWERVFEHLANETDNEYAMIDSTIVRAHRHSAGAPKKR